MIINTAQSNSSWKFPARRQLGLFKQSGGGVTRFCARLIALWLMSFAAAQSQAATILGPWVPMFKGIEHAVGTNTAGGGGFPDLQVVHFLRVDLTDPDIRLLASPRRTNWVANGSETYAYTITNFVKVNGVQVAINANQFSPSSYFQAEGIACNANGMVFSQGKMVSPAVTSGSEDFATFYFTSNNVPTYYPTNLPAAPTNGVYTALSGVYNILYNGVNIGSNYTVHTGIHDLEPRTAYGLSQNKRYLFLLTIDGRQPGYSDGAYDWETAEWLKLAGAWEGANMDGGGSTCMAMMDTAGNAIPLNRDSASLTAPGFRERTVGAHLGIYAAPLPGFFNNIKALPDDTAATITYTTISAATTQLKYGTTTNLTSLTASNAILASDHAVLLTNLTPNTSYYFAALASTGTNIYVSSTYLFLTTNYVTTNTLFDLTNTWKYMTANLDGIGWTARTYDDSGWDGSGPGLLWSDYRGPNANIPVALNTEMPQDAESGAPFSTYYFRTHFNFTNNPAGATLQLQGYIDDGAVFYLNGKEIYRLRMAAAPTLINNVALASGYACSGDATCTDYITVSGAVIATNLMAGDNVLSVEVHNYNPGSPDITLGAAASLTLPYILRPTLSVNNSNSAVGLSWSQGGYTLQQAITPTGVWADVSGPVVSSPFTTNSPVGNRFYRLRK